MRLCLCWVLVLWVAANIVAGQSDRGPINLAGTVVDPSGASVPGADVFLRRLPETQARRSVTDGQGYFQFERTIPGKYEIRVLHHGFKPVTTTVTVGRSPIPPLLIGLEIADFRQEFTVGDDQERVSIGAGENVDVVRLDRELLDNLPVLDQDFIGAASEFLDQGLTSSAGVSLVVDGMETTDIGVSPSAIQEVRINRNPYSAEFSRPGRGRIEVVTRKGASRYHGTANFVFRDHRLNARNAFATTRPPEQRRIYEGYLTGPVGKNGKTSFVVSAERKEDDEWSVVYALTPSGLVTDQVPQPERDSEVSLRIDRRESDARSFSLRYELEDEASLARGAGGFTLPETTSDRKTREHDVLFSHRSVIDQKLVNELRLRAEKNDRRTTSVLTGKPKIVVLDAFTSGGAQDDDFSRDYRGEFGDVLSWAAGRHFLKAGVSFRDIGRRAFTDLTDRDGAFYFSSLEDFRLGAPYSFTQQTGDGSVVFWTCETAGFIQDDFRIRHNFSVGLGMRYEWQTHPSDRNNFAPRLSFAYAPGRQRSTVIRGGAGLFYDGMNSGAIRDMHLFSGTRLHRVLLSFPGYPDPFSGRKEISLLPPNIVRFSPELVTPRLLNYGLGVEHQLLPKTTLAIHYSGAVGNRMFRSRDWNAPVPPDYSRPDPAIGVLRQIESSSRLEGRSLDLSLRGSLTPFFKGAVMYTLGRVCSDADGIDVMPADNLDPSGEWSRASYDRRHRFRTFGTIRAGRLFSLGVMLRLSSGRPYSLTTGRDDNHDGRANDRPPGVPRNSLQGPGSATLDVRWSKDFSLQPGRDAEEGPSIRLALDAFNVLNRVNYAGFVGNMSSPFFGQPVAAREPRRLQLSLRLKF